MTGPGRGTGARDEVLRNADPRTVEGFGREWARFDQTGLSAEEGADVFAQYFRIFPWASLPPDARGFDLGCGSGRWARIVAPRVGTLHCIDASREALEVARTNLRHQSNTEFHHASVSAIPLEDASMDFGYCLGVLHHTPDPAAGLASAVRKLRRGAPLLVYLYYAFDNRAAWFRALWRASDLGRQVISRLPDGLKAATAEAIAALVYFPLARGSALVERAGFDVDSMPLSFYRHRSFYVMRTDALDRFGTRLEKRFTADELRSMMRDAGLRDVELSDRAPFWCAVGRRE